MQGQQTAEAARGGALARPRAALAAEATRYWLTVQPLARREIARWRARAEAIEDPTARSLALRALAKRGNIEGAAAFAVLAPRVRRAVLVRALVALQSAYNYADIIAEQPSGQPVEVGRRVHEALVLALDAGRSSASRSSGPRRARGAPTAEGHGQISCHGRGENGGPGPYGTPLADAAYMDAMVGHARMALETLPSYETLAPVALRAAEHIVVCQSLVLGERAAAHERLAQWAQTQALDELDWWEAAAAGGSSLCLYALVAVAATPGRSEGEGMALERAYFPWIGALHSLLDNLLDQDEDAAAGQLNLVSCYPSAKELVERMGTIAARALDRAGELPDGERHTVAVAAMAGYYLAEIQACEHARPETLAAARAIADTLGSLAAPVRTMFALRRATGSLTG